MIYILALMIVRLDKSVHRRRGGAVLRAMEQLSVHVGKLVSGVRIQLALKLCQRLYRHRCACRVRIGFAAGQPVDPGILCRQTTKHVIERPVLHHEHHDVFQVVNARTSHEFSSCLACSSVILQP